jgi:ABC-type nitrate/sulfonate/bicarbonate transport system substrate-binding protein
LIGVSEELDELRALEQGNIDALVVSDPQELGRRAMQAMRVALSGASARSWSGQLPVQILTRASMNKNPIVALLTRGETSANSSPGRDPDVAP